MINSGKNKSYGLEKTITIVFTLVFAIVSCNNQAGGGMNTNGENKTETIINPSPDDKYRIYIDTTTNQFMVDGKRIWINGVNTPWHDWDEFGSTWYTLNENWWDAEFARLRNAGINAVRVWISCRSAVNQVTISANGTVSGAAAKHWSDVDKLFNLAKKHKLYIMATLLSFDHFKPETSPGVTDYSPRWRAMLNNNNAVASYVNNYTIPFVNRYKDNPYLWSIDICNEPDWIHEEQGIPWNRISYFLAANAAAIHEHSNILVTVGMAYAKWNTGSNNPSGNTQGTNRVSDQYLKGLYNNNPKAHLDFWSPHYYGWNAEWYGVAHYLKPGGGERQGSKTNGYYGGYGILVDAANPAKPAVIGECSAKGTGIDERNYIRASERPSVNNIINDYEFAYNNGWQGVMAWTSNAVDENGGLYAANGNPQTELGQATLNMKNKYPALIYPFD